MPLKVTHIITGLAGGGAEGVLVRLCLASRDLNCEHSVISLTGRGKHADSLEEAGINVVCLELGGGTWSALKFWRLIELLRSAQPDVVQTWMYHADLVGGIAARLAGVRAVVWGVRNTASNLSVYKRRTSYVIRACALVSRFVPHTIIVCAQNVIDSHVKLGYCRDKMIAIPNGYDLNQFVAISDKVNEWRDKNGIKPTAALIGLVGRYSPQKDHKNLLQALGQLASRGGEFQCILVGEGMSQDNAEIVSLINSLGLSKRVNLLGARADIPEIMRSLDLHVLSSRIEGFPNVLAEAMASGTPCVSTDVGDAERILAGHGWLVPTENASELSEAIGDALEERRDSPTEWQRRRENCRRHIVESYSLQRMVDAYLETWRRAV